MNVPSNFDLPRREAEDQGSRLRSFPEYPKAARGWYTSGMGRVKLTTCVECDAQFERKPDHRGKANVCLSCGGDDVPLLMAKVTWEDKQTPVVEIVSAKEARRVAALQKRFGAGVLSSITERREEPDEPQRRNDKGSATPGQTSSQCPWNVQREAIGGNVNGDNSRNQDVRCC